MNDATTDRRYLTPGAKRRELARWSEERARHASVAERGGRGYPDPDIVPWCERINALPGVCTLQSCQGHADPEDGAGTYPGTLWLWLDEETSARFDARAIELARRTDLIESVERRYQHYGREVHVIVFHGNERRKLDASMRLVLDFLRSLRGE